MQLKISHTTSYHYDAPVPYALQQLRLRPKSRPDQIVRSWEVKIDGGQRQVSFEDEHANTVELISFDPGVSEITVHCAGEVHVTDTAGVIGKHTGFVPLWLFERSTSLTAIGPQVRSLVAGFDKPAEPLDQLHALSAHVLEMVPYSTDQTSSELSAEQVLSARHGVCQDHAHVFIAAARWLGFPARYVSGYLMMNDRVDQDASHAWAEAYVAGLGWVGFDISNAMSPDARYVRVATGLDYLGAAPISGMRYGKGAENMLVKLQVEQQ
ncbi:transglutaminase family protein [Aestuariivita sp.]|jgi:transglutaminase-like putative cysteine protease|uniref:transglutaminase family protein n=1 Tax=Aestuariivita sp. TaxID=1872407 RepID=UPI00216DA94E|nr:transglutaminase family protein [Aestuariivita sp.]MCE8007651.1 transglutaminase family protein [Aestuariivita sp.]